MGRKRVPGLVKRNQIWNIDKKINGRRICESTGTGSLEEAEKFLVHRMEQIRQAKIYGVRPKRMFREAALKFVQENSHKASLHGDIGTIKKLDPYIGTLYLEAIHMGSLRPFIQARQQEGVKARTINAGLEVVRHILNLAVGEWLDEDGLTWLASAPKIRLLPETDKRKPFPLSWVEQENLFKELPPHLLKMAIFKANTGCRDQEICRLRWEWEIPIPELNSSVFIIPGELVKNRDDRLLVLNRVARSVLEEVRGQHPTHVFTYKSKPMTRMTNSAWTNARGKAGLKVRVHDLKHTFGRRLRAAGVSYEDRQDLLGHKSQRITTHYSAAEISNLIAAANKACDWGNISTLTILRSKNLLDSQFSPSKQTLNLGIGL